MKKIILLLTLAVIMLLAGCSSADRSADKESSHSKQVKDDESIVSSQVESDDESIVRSYTMISQDEAKEMMKKSDGHIIVDVRRQDEYDSGHIPEAILIPNESIEKKQPEQLPDYDQIILIYCRSGNRSKQAAQKLADMGYTNIYEFGGINTWTGEIVKGE